MSLYWAGDGIELHLGDCREVQEWLRADVLVTDPPYGIGWSQPQLKAIPGDPKRTLPTRSHDGIQNDGSTVVRDAALQLWGDTRASIVFGSWKAEFPTHRQILVWRKPSTTGMFGAHLGFRKDTELIFLSGDWPSRSVHRSSVLTTDGHHVGYLQDGHPHQKPVRLLEELIDAAPPGTIADPFAGSGSTLVAAKLRGRQAIGVEIDERYCEIAARRLDQGVLDFEAS
jgi:DNA modification methylase